MKKNLHRFLWLLLFINATLLIVCFVMLVSDFAAKNRNIVTCTSLFAMNTCILSFHLTTESGNEKTDNESQEGSDDDE